MPTVIHEGTSDLAAFWGNPGATVSFLQAVVLHIGAICTIYLQDKAPGSGCTRAPDAY